MYIFAKPRPFAAALLFSFSVQSGLTVAQQPSDDGAFYYSIGGGAPIGLPASTQTQTVTLGASLDWGSNLTCGDFDPFVTVSNQLNGVTAGFQQMMGNVIQAATAAVASLPGLILQRANPGLYDLMQNGVLQGKLDLEFAKSSCEEISRQLADKLPVDDWTLVSTGQRWRQVAATDQDIIEAKRTVDASAGEGGVPWVCDQLRGGAGQLPVEVNADTVTAGYNILLNRGPCDSTAVVVAVPEDERIAVHWDTPATAAAFAVEVLGDAAIRTCEGCGRLDSTPGKGLAFVHDSARVDVETALINLVSATTTPTLNDLMAVSAPPGIVLTRPLIEAIRADEERDRIIDRLAGEIALAQTLERALLVRRMLQTGKREPNIASIGPAQAALETSLSDLTAEIDGLLYELNVRAAITSNTAQKLLVRKQQRDLSAPQEVLLPSEPPFSEGAIRP
jgi:integrating conjugative element protein (TIGR03755 family)